jgi:hypothetical protein
MSIKVSRIVHPAAMRFSRAGDRIVALHHASRDARFSLQFRQ